MYNILMVDESKDFLDEIKRFNIWNNNTGFEIIDVALNGKEALNLLNNNAYDIVITDVKVPIIDGIELLREIKKKHLSKCVIFLIEYTDFCYTRQAIILGAFDYLAKPVTEKDIIEVLNRSKLFLDNLKNKKSLEDKLDTQYEEKQIIHYLIMKDKSCINLFNKSVKNIYEYLEGDNYKTYLAIDRLFNNIITGVYNEFGWLHDFINKNYFENIYYQSSKDLRYYVNVYNEKILFLLNFIDRVYLQTSDDLINKIFYYILCNSKNDLKLKSIAEKFYINSTYLSNIFIKKTGISFNDYVTMIKMERARYFLYNTKLKTAEISYEVGYRDVNYFSKIFKKYYGENPSALRNKIKIKI